MLNEHQLDTRETLITYFTRYLSRELNKVNPAFRFLRIETPILLPFSVDKDRLQTVRLRLDNEDLMLRENTTTGAYEASKDILSGKGTKQKLPIVVWQHGKIFERINRQIVERYNLEYQILYSNSTGQDYAPIVTTAVGNMIHKQCGPIQDGMANGLYRVCDETNLLASVRIRDDFWNGKNLEVVFDMDQITEAAIRQEKRGRKKLTKALTMNATAQ